MENRRQDIETKAGLRPSSVTKDVPVHSPLSVNEETAISIISSVMFPKQH
jgi:hypothetical protein